MINTKDKTQFILCVFAQTKSPNAQMMRMEMVDFWAIVFNPDAQAKFVHTVSACYVTGSMFVLSNLPGAAFALPPLLDWHQA